MSHLQGEGPESAEWRAKVDLAVRNRNFTGGGVPWQQELEPDIGCLAGIEGCECNSLYSKYADHGGREYFHAALNTYGQEGA